MNRIVIGQGRRQRFATANPSLGGSDVRGQKSERRDERTDVRGQLYDAPRYFLVVPLTVRFGLARTELGLRNVQSSGWSSSSPIALPAQQGHSQSRFFSRARESVISSPQFL